MKRNIVLTGSSTGIGRSIASQLVQEGHFVWGVARSDQSSLQKELSLLPGKFTFSRTDVSSWNEVSQFEKELSSKWSHVDAVICASGIQGSVGPAMTANPIEWQNTIRVNLDGTYFPLRALFPLLRKSPASHAKVICFSGGGATSSRPYFSAYAAAKTGIVRLVEVLSEEWKDLPMDINSIAPGAIHTRMTEEVIAMGPDKAGQKEYECALKVKKTGGASLEKVYGLVKFLLSNESDGISGRLISAQWDSWDQLHSQSEELMNPEVFTLRRILPSSASH